MLGCFLQEESADQYLALSLESIAEFCGFWSLVSLYDSRPAGNRQGTPVSKGQKDLWAAVNKAHRRSLELGLKGERDKARTTRDKPGRSMPMLEGQCAAKVLQSAVLVKAGDGDSHNSKDGLLVCWKPQMYLRIVTQKSGLFPIKRWQNQQTN